MLQMFISAANAQSCCFADGCWMQPYRCSFQQQPLGRAALQLVLLWFMATEMPLRADINSQQSGIISQLYPQQKFHPPTPFRANSLVREASFVGVPDSCSDVHRRLVTRSCLIDDSRRDTRPRQQVKSGKAV